MKTDALFVALAVLGSSFWGSWHCAAMCGPIASIAARRNSLCLYHLGRGLSYVLLGVLGGFVGSFFFSSEFKTVRVVAGLVFASVLISMGVQTFRGRQVLQAPKFPWLHYYFTRQAPGFVLGVLSIFLPCGWLYSYVLAAVATRSAWAGALLMLLFWLAGLPALSAISIFMKSAIQIAPKRKQVMAGIVLTVAGVYSLISFYFMSGHSH